MESKLQSVFDEVLIAIERGELSFPVFPEIADRVRKLINDPNISAQEVVAAISGDIGISAHLIKVANSAAYADKPKVEHLRQAISRLGYKQVHNLVLQVTLSELLHTSNPVISRYLQDYWKRNREVAAFCYVLAQNDRQFNPDQAMLAGMLHNIGALPLCLYVDRPDFALDVEELYALIDKLHVPVGAKLLKAWNFPEAMIEIISGSEVRPEGAPHYADLVKVANLLSQPIGRTIDWAGVKAVKRLRLDENVCHTFEQRYSAQLACARSLLGIESEGEGTQVPPQPVAAATPPRVPSAVRPRPGLLASILRWFGLR